LLPPVTTTFPKSSSALLTMLFMRAFTYGINNSMKMAISQPHRPKYVAYFIAQMPYSKCCKNCSKMHEKRHLAQAQVAIR
jgi:hypothetical protein